MNINDESGWLVGANIKQTTDISDDELRQLLELANKEDDWENNVRNEVIAIDENPFQNRNFFLDEIRVMNTGGTIIQYPFGYTCSFPSRRHLFRGERKDYPYTEATLSRRCRKSDGTRRSQKERELLHIVANMRVAQFRKFIWQFDIIPQWEAKLSDVNYKALAQHYGFETFLLDLTNDVRSALFFATCKWVDNHFEPLTYKDINESYESRYGVIYHTPDWKIDYINGINMLKLQPAFEKDRGRNTPSIIDTGLWDGVAYQIGLQPFYRTFSQYGYVYPMKKLDDIRYSGVFERLRFRQSVDFSKYIYELMDCGRKIYPDEGITAVSDVLRKMQTSFKFSEDDVEWAYKIDEADTGLFPDIDKLISALQSEETERLFEEVYGLPAVKFCIQKAEVIYMISDAIKKYINKQYNDKCFLDPVGGILHEKPEARKYRDEQFFRIYGTCPE